MIRKLCLAVALAGSCLAGSAGAVVLDFENVPNGSVSNTYGEMPTTNGASDYSGFVFSSNLDWIDTVGSTWSYGARSGEFTLLNNNGGVGTLSAADGSDFTFSGLWAKRWATAPESGGTSFLFGTLEGWKDGAQVWSVDTGLNGSFQFFGGQAGLIDELRLGFGNFFLVDDLALNETNTPAVPLPAGIVLLLSGLTGMRFLKRRG